MNRGLIGLVLGLGIGILVGYNNEEEIDDICHRTKRAKKNMMKQFHQMQDYLD